MMSKLATKDGGTNQQFKPQIYQSTRRGKMRNFYERHYYQNIDQIVEIGESNLVVEFSMDKFI